MRPVPVCSSTVPRQSPIRRVNVQTLDPDFYVASGHKIYGPTGIGALYGKPEVLEKMPPWQGGGNMIRHVTFEGSTFQDPPGRFEAGTGNIADAIGFGTALDYLERVGIDNVERYEHDLLDYATRQMLGVNGLHMIGTAPEKASVLSFVLDRYRPDEVGTALNREGIAVRAGHHCAQPILCFGQRVVQIKRLHAAMRRSVGGDAVEGSGELLSALADKRPQESNRMSLVSWPASRQVSAHPQRRGDLEARHPNRS